MTPRRAWRAADVASAAVMVGGAVLAGVVAAGSVAAAPDSPVLPVAFVGGIILLVAAVLRPLWIVGVGVLVIPLEGYFPGLVGPSQGFLGLAALGWLVGLVARRPLTLPRHPALVGFGLLVLANAAALLFAPEPFVVARQVVTWGTLLILAVAIAQIASDDQIRRLLTAFAAAGGLAGAVAIVDPQPLTSFVFAGGDVNRATGGLGSPNALGMLLTLAIPVQIVLALGGTRLERLVGAGGAVLALVGMTLAVSRGAFLGLALALLVLAWWPPFRRAALIALPLVAVLAMVGANPESRVFDTSKLVERLTEVKTTGAKNSRIVLWEKAPAMFADRPVFGMGGLEYGYYTASYGIPSSEGVAPHAHSLVLTIAVESGTVGLTGLLLLFGTLATGLRRATRRLSGLLQGLAFALLASFAGFFASGLLDYALGAAPIAAAFFVPVGCAVALILRAQEPRPAA